MFVEIPSMVSYDGFSFKMATAWPVACPLIWKVAVGRFFCLISKLVKWATEERKHFKIPDIKKKSGYWLMFWGHACLPRQSMWLWADGHPFPLNRTTIMGGICPTKSEKYHSTQTFCLPQLSLPCQDNDVKSCFTAETSQVDQMMYERQQNPLK